MKTFNLSRKTTAFLLVALLAASPPRWALALPCPEPGPAADASARAEAARQYAAAGLTPEEAVARAETLNPDEAAHVAGTEEIRRGGDVGTIALILIAAAAISYIVWDYMYYHRAPAY